jgi:hypothetical protein
MTIKSRLTKLEAAAGVGEVYSYGLVITNGWAEGITTPEERAKGYKIQSYIRSAGGTGDGEFYLPTIQDVIAFGNRPDVDLHITYFGGLTPEEAAALGKPMEAE